ncbi:TIGR02680 family protein [Raineyella antarctica]|uniref:TIGR02680 family protein n=1 Tax=Raineyella antarctica TaxID=1577474 RepID=A0A1G6HHJ5_9ACTN|nr:TIGR02680 family protein [Raineyella antarctica]SDB93664.1 TIGR02680 family protein [Raineyella antarctica]
MIVDGPGTDRGVVPLDALPDTLSVWLAAAQAGGFPTPSREDRWQPMRAGVVNLWEFEAAEYWYANGWVQLTGRNETGKSSLMALTTLIPWLADTSSTNIDTLGRSGKKFRYYVEPTGQDGDRRSSDTSTNRGWLWVEYGRLVEGTPRFFTTMLFAEARAASSSVTLGWCTAEGGRVRESVDLAPHRLVAHPKDLASCGVLSHPSATAYKQYVARHLLGSTPDRLEAAGKMLRVTRTPKLGAQLEIGFVSEQLRTALPELDRTEVDALAAGWDQLDHLRADLEATDQAVATVEKFRRTAWLPWVRAELRRRADIASRARTDFDRVTREERSARDRFTSLTEQERQLTDDLRTASQDANAARTATEELQDSARFRDAQARLQTLEQRRREANQLRDQQLARTEFLGRARSEEQAAAQEADRYRELVEKSRAETTDARDELARAAVDAHVPVPSGDVDLHLLDQRVRERRQEITRARALLVENRRADQDAARAEDVAASTRDRATEDRTSAEQAWQDAETRRATLVEAVSAWATTLTPEPAAAAIDAWIAALPSGVSDDGRVAGRPLREVIQADWYLPVRDAVRRREQAAASRRAEAEARVAALGERIEQLRSAPPPVFAPPAGWLRRQRPDASATGAPLWALVDPRPEVPADDLSRIEAAMAAQGLLDAWVTPDGVFRPERDGNDLVVATGVGDGMATPPDRAQEMLSSVLVPAEGREDLAPSVTRMLAGVRLLTADEPIPETGIAVGRDGRWRSGVLAGRAAPEHAHPEWIGDSARAAQRRRAIEELSLAREEARDEAGTAASDEQREAAQLLTLARTFERCPSDTELRHDLTLAAERDAAAEKSAADAARKQAAADQLRTTADRALAAVRDFCAQRQLPNDEAGLEVAVEALAEAERVATRFRSRREALVVTEHTFDEARGRLLGRQQDVVTAQRQLSEAEGRLATVEATVAALESTLDADDHAVMAELDRLRAAEQAASGERDRLQGILRVVGTNRGEAQAKLSGAEERRSSATMARDQAFAGFRVLVDRGLGDEAELDLPDVHASTVDKVRDQVAAARRQLDLDPWPDDATAQTTEERRLYGRLSEAVHEVRALLETRGRSLQLVPDDLGLPRIEVQVDATGVPLGPREAATKLAQIHADLGATYTARVQETLDELLGSTFLEHLRGRVGATDALVNRINTVLADHQVVTTSTSLRIVLEPEATQDRMMLDAVRGPSLANPEAAVHVRNHLRTRVEAAKRQAAAAGEADWRDRLVETLDYRRWFNVQLQRKVGSSGTWRPLTSQGFAEMSGGARAVMLMLPLVATLAALYEDMDGAPRPLWLDEAFDGLDSANRAMIMDLFRSFDLDVLLAGPTRLVNVRTVPAASIYQVVRSPAPFPGADLTLELWAGGDLTVVNLPATLPVGAPATGDGPQEALL